MNNYKAGDMCFFEFKLSEIKEIKDGGIVEISDGYFNTSTGGDFSDRVFPVNLRIKLISAEYESYHHEIHKKGLGTLNFPDIHRWLVAHWSETCQKPGDSDWIGARYAELRDFSKEITDKCEELNSLSLKTGIRLMR